MGWVPLEFLNVLFLGAIVPSRVTHIRNGVNITTMTLNVRTVKAILVIGNHRSELF